MSQVASDGDDILSTLLLGRVLTAYRLELDVPTLAGDVAAGCFLEELAELSWMMKVAKQSAGWNVEEMW